MSVTVQGCGLLDNNIPARLLVAENRGQISNFCPTVKFRGGIGEMTDTILPVRLTLHIFTLTGRPEEVDS